MPPSPEWEVLLAPFESCFTRPGYRYFCAFVKAFAHLDGRLFVTQVILSGYVGRHFTSYYRFLGEGVWSIEGVVFVLWKLVCAACITPTGHLFVAIDDTVCRKRGPKFFGVGFHHDPMNRDHPKKLSRGHCFVCLAALGQQGASHVAALFVSCALYVQQKVCTDEYPFFTKLELAADLFNQLAIPVGAALIAVADGAYAKREFVQSVVREGCHVISRLRRDMVFYDLPPVRRQGQKGRGRKYGKKWKGADWAKLEKGWRGITLCLYGHSTTLSIKTRVVKLRSLEVTARIVAVRWGSRPIVFLFSTETSLNAEAIVRAYCARFAIETGFRDSKQLFALWTYQVRKAASVLRIVHLCFWAQTLLRLRFWKAAGTPALDGISPAFGEWRKPLDYLTLGQQKRLSKELDPDPSPLCRLFEGSDSTLKTIEKDPSLDAPLEVAA